MSTFQPFALVLAISLLSFSSIFGQTLQGVVEDDNGSPVAYATIYAPAAEIGVLTDEKGNFSLDLKEIPDTSQVQFSCIGYTSKTLKAGDLRQMKPGIKVELPVVEYLLKTAEVSAEQIKFKRKKLGMSGIMNGTYGFVTTDKRQIFEMGTLLTPDGPARLNEIVIKVRDMEADSVLMDVNIYDVQFGIVGEPILKKRVFLELSQEDVRRDISIDVSAQRITVERDFLVTFRVLDVVGPFGKIKLSAKTGTGRGFTRTSDGRWQGNYMTPNIRAVVGYKKE